MHCKSRVILETAPSFTLAFLQCRVVFSEHSIFLSSIIHSYTANFAFNGKCMKNAYTGQTRKVDKAQ